MPSKIDSYCHRIGRTGRAGRSGISITYLTDEDTEVMYDLKNYLESTNAYIPDQLMNHDAASAPPGSMKDSRGKVIKNSNIIR